MNSFLVFNICFSWVHFMAPIIVVVFWFIFGLLIFPIVF